MSITWDPADGAPPPLEARAAYERFKEKTRNASPSSFCLAGFFSPPDQQQQENKLVGYKIVREQQPQQGEATSASTDDSSSSSNAATSEVAVTVVATDTAVWNKTWGSLFEDEHSQDNVFDFVSEDGKVGALRCVMIRLYGVPQRNNNNYSTAMHQQQQDNNDGGSSTTTTTLSPTDLKTLLSLVEAQAFSCGPVEFARLANENKEIVVQFTTKTAAKIFLATCVDDDDVDGYDSSSGGVFAKMKSEYGLSQRSALLVPAQRIEQIKPSGTRGRGSVRHMTQAARDEANKAFLQLKGCSCCEDGEPGVAAASSIVMRLPEQYVKAMFDAAGASEVISAPFSVVAVPEEAPQQQKQQDSSSPTTTSSEKPQEGEVTSSTAAAASKAKKAKKNSSNKPALFKSFLLTFDTYHEALAALHLVQYPLRTIFGLSLTYCDAAEVAAAKK